MFALSMVDYKQDAPVLSALCGACERSRRSCGPATDFTNLSGHIKRLAST